VLGAILSLPAQAATLSAADVTMPAGATATVPLLFASEGQTIAGLQFDITPDPSTRIRIFPGAQLGAAGKVVYTAGLPNSGVRAVIIGFNLEPLRDGELLRPLISIDPGAAPGTSQLHLDHIVATDSSGQPVAFQAADINLQIQAATTGAPAVLTVVNGASLLPGPLSPGEIVTILGGPALAATAAVRINAAPAPVLYSGPGQVNAIVPFGLDTTTTATVDLSSDQQPLGTAASQPTAAVAPAIFSVGGNGGGPGAILNEDYSINSPSNPAARGSVVIIYGTGLGALNPAIADGSVATDPSAAVAPVSASVGGSPADVLYAGSAPTLIAGVAQINIRIPADLPPASAAPVVLTVAGVSTPPSITVAIR
jgi:uncharacterized protein (TIGR03437 family)